jgi:NADH-quinone oxidoreductase subunit K
MEIQILFAAMLFLIGLIGFLVRRNIIFMLMSIEIMLNSAALVFVIAGAHWLQADGQVMFIFILLFRLPRYQSDWLLFFRCTTV